MTVSAQSERHMGHHAFSIYMGSGLYKAGSNIAQVYRATPSVTLLSPFQHPWGITLRMPATVGFLNYRYWDVFSKGLPKGVETIAVLPMLEIEHYPRPTISIAPVLGLGAAVNMRLQTHLWGAAAGIRHFFFIPVTNSQLRLYSLVIYEALLTHSGGEYDELVMWKYGAELRQKLGVSFLSKELDAGGFVVNYLYFASPRLWMNGAGIYHQRWEIEAGITVGTVEPLYFMGFKLPRVGIGYRFSADRSSLTVLAGDNFPIPSPEQQALLKEKPKRR